jgi:hypothetical protein
LHAGLAVVMAGLIALGAGSGAAHAGSFQAAELAAAGQR